MIAYRDPLSADGKPITNGYGSTRNMAGRAWEEGSPCSESEALWMLRRDVEEAYWPCKTIPYWDKMNAHQRAALADLNYNEGYTYGDGDHETLDRGLKERRWEDVGLALQLYDNNDQLGISRRRYAEWLMFREKSRPEDAYFTAWGYGSVAEIMEAIAQ